MAYVSEYGSKFVDGVMVMHARNVCFWYDGTIRAMKGHHGNCRWHFDGQVWWHE